MQRTRAALLLAFRDLILENRFEQVNVADIAKRAKVSRSTLYQHFAGKDGLLAASIATLFSILANTVRSPADEQQLVFLLEHFWANRRLARTVLSGPLRRKTAAVLVQQIEDILKAKGLARRGALLLPPRLAAVQLAELLLAPLIAWLSGESRSSAAVLAPALQRVVSAAVAALRTGRPR